MSNPTNNPVCWFEIYVDDMKRAQTFYEGILAIQLEELASPTPEMEVEMMTFPMSKEGYGAAGALTKMKGFPAGANSTLIYFACEDCAVEAARVADHGGKVIREKTSLGEHGFMVLAHDTEGNMIGLHSLQ